MKKVVKFLLLILTILFTVLLSLNITIFTIRKLSENYISREFVLNTINNIDINELLTQNGEEIEEIKIIKDKFKEAGIPEELIIDFISSEPIKEATTDVTNRVIDYVFYGKESEYEIKEDEIYSFLEEKLPIISKELQEKNIPKSEYLTQENQTKILNKVKQEIPIIQQNLNKIMKKVENKLQNSEYQDKFNKILSITKTIYSKEVTILLFVIFIICIIFICLTRRSIFKSLKWIGFGYLISSILLYIMSLIIPLLLEKMNEIPDLFMNVIIFIFDKLVQSLQQFSLKYIIIAFILIVANIIIHIIRTRKMTKIEINL